MKRTQDEISQILLRSGSVLEEVSLEGEAADHRIELLRLDFARILQLTNLTGEKGASDEQVRMF